MFLCFFFFVRLKKKNIWKYLNLHFTNIKLLVPVNYIKLTLNDETIFYSNVGLGQRERRKEVQSEFWSGQCHEANARYAVADQVI